MADPEILGGGGAHKRGKPLFQLKSLEKWMWSLLFLII